MGEGRLRAGTGLFDKQLWARSLLRDGMIIFALRAVPVTSVYMCVILLASIRFARWCFLPFDDAAFFPRSDVIVQGIKF